MSFNLVIEVLVVSSPESTNSKPNGNPSFNLVIEVLVVSSRLSGVGIHRESQFQSRNRGSCRFKALNLANTTVEAFGSFNLVIEVLVVSSKYDVLIAVTGLCFNLVIEVLVVSSLGAVDGGGAGLGKLWFQSRNRGSCRFKHSFLPLKVVMMRRFNLVIEVLVVSRMTFQHCKRQAKHTSFNLVIEVLVVSRSLQRLPGHKPRLSVSIS